MAHSITLVLSTPTLVQTSNGHYAFRVRIDAVDAVMMPATVFVFREQLLDPITGLKNAEFCTVASPVDLSEIPVSEPGAETMPPLFRRSVIDTIVRSREQVQEFFDDVHEEVCSLVSTLDLVDRLAEEQRVTCGEVDPETSESSSLS